MLRGNICFKFFRFQLHLCYPKHSSDNTEHINTRSNNNLYYGTTYYLKNYCDIFNPLKTKRRLLYLKTQFIPRRLLYLKTQFVPCRLLYLKTQFVSRRLLYLKTQFVPRKPLYLKIQFVPRRLLYLETHFVPRRKHFSSGL